VSGWWREESERVGEEESIARPIEEVNTSYVSVAPVAWGGFRRPSAFCRLAVAMFAALCCPKTLLCWVPKLFKTRCSMAPKAGHLIIRFCGHGSPGITRAANGQQSSFEADCLSVFGGKKTKLAPEANPIQASYWAPGRSSR